MITVFVPIGLLIILILFKKIPFIKGNVMLALMSAGFVALLMGGLYNPIEWIKAWIFGLDKLAWIIALGLFGSIYAETQTELKTLDSVLTLLRSIFGKSPRGIVVSTIIALGIAGSLLGDAIASATVIGILVIKVLNDLEIEPEGIAAIITSGGMLGSIMPPITQSIFLSSSLVGVDVSIPANYTYITISIGTVLTTVYMCKRFVKIKQLPEHLIPQGSLSEIMRGRWLSFIPLLCLVIMVLLDTALNINVVMLVAGPLIKWLSGITIIKGVANYIVTFLIAATIISFFYKSVRSNGWRIIKTGAKNAVPGLRVFLGSALLLGSFYSAGQIEAVNQFASNLSPDALKIGGAVAMIVVGTLTGSQSTAQNTIFSWLAPALVNTGVDPHKLAVSAAHIASGAQGFPPTSITALVVCALVGGILNKKVDPIKGMMGYFPLSLYMVLVGILFMYI
jgi:TRAP-type C4-dicarboxylate transport system permease large subunit